MRPSVRRFFLLVASAVLATGASPAFAATSKRAITYAGSTSNDNPIVVHLTPDRKQIDRFVTMWDAPCTAGGSFEMGAPIAVVSKIGKDGSFEASREVDTPSGDTVHLLSMAVKGRVKERAASGTWSITLQEYDPAGALVDTCAVRFTFKAAAALGRVFGGVTSQDLPVVIELSKGGSSVRHMHFGWDATCKPDGLFEFGDTLLNLRLTNDRFGGAFAFDVNQPEGEKLRLAYTLRGTLLGTRARGTLRVRATARDAAGAVTTSCDTRAITWKVASG
jgi:hypothetical protein